MATRSRTPLAGFRWLWQAINLGRSNPRAVFGGAALLLVASLLPSLLTLPIQMGWLRTGAPQPQTFFLLLGCSSLIGLFLVPVFAGYLRVIDAAERGQPARARDVFAPYRQGETLRLAGYGLAMLLVYLLMLALIVGAAGRDLAGWYMQVLGAQASGQAPPTQLPEGFGIAIAMAAVLGLLVMGVYSISLGQVALRGRSVPGALRDGLAGSIKNVLPLLVFALSLLVAWIVAALLMTVAVVVASLLAKLVGAWLLVVLAVPVYLAFVIAIFVVMFGTMYHLWRDVCDEGPGTSPAPALAA